MGNCCIFARHEGDECECIFKLPIAVLEPYDYGSFLFYFLVVSCKLKSIFAPSEMYFLNLFLFYVHL